ncbi:MAG TPA: hypothetical protein VFI46_06295 [Jiangellaceae bacterium]|nr:hypothetical protein [Jiangellaceae bacterium]
MINGSSIATSAVVPEQERSWQTLPDTSAVAVRHAVQVPDTRGRSAASGVTRRMRSPDEPLAATVDWAAPLQPATRPTLAPRLSNWRRSDSRIDAYW